MKQFHNEPTEAYFLLIKQVSNLSKNKKRIWLCTKRIKSAIDKTKRINATIGYGNKTNRYGITLMNGK